MRSLLASGEYAPTYPLPPRGIEAVSHRVPSELYRDLFGVVLLYLMADKISEMKEDMLQLM